MKSQLKIRKILPQLFIAALLWLVAMASIVQAGNIRSDKSAGSNTNSLSYGNPPSPEGLIRAQADLTSTYQVFLPFITGGTGIRIHCDHSIDSDVDVADGRTNYSDVKPGDWICIESGSRNKLVLQNFEGTADQPIVFINHGGQVLFDRTSDFGIAVQNSRFLRISGIGDTKYLYGFKVDGNYSAGITLQRKSSDFEVDHFEIRNVNFAGIFAKTDAVCPDGSSNKFDYDGDGLIKGDLDDVVTRNNFTQYNSVIHDNYIYNASTEGFYIGSSFYDVGESLSCDNGSQSVLPPVLKGVKVYNNILEKTGWDGIQVGAAVEDCAIYNNRIYRDSQDAKVHQQSGIMNNRGSVCDIYNNLIKDGGGTGIYAQGNGNNRIYNNVIVRAGQNHTENSGYGMKLDTGSNTGNSIYVWNNTIIQPRDIGISFISRKGSDNRVENNIIVQPGGGSDAYIFLSGQSQARVSHNFTSSNVDGVRFINPAEDDYMLQSNSPVVDSGVNLESQDVKVDYRGIARPQGSGFDLGAYEFTVGVPATATPTPAPPTNTPAPTFTPSATPEATSTPIPATATRTPAPATPTPTVTRTPVPATPTATNTPSPATPTSAPATATPTNTPPPNTPTATSLPPTDTPTPEVPTSTPTETPTPEIPTVTPTATETPIP